MQQAPFREQTQSTGQEPPLKQQERRQQEQHQSMAKMRRNTTLTKQEVVEAPASPTHKRNGRLQPKEAKSPLPRVKPNKNIDSPKSTSTSHHQHLRMYGRSPIGQSPSQQSPRITTASIRQEMKDAINQFPNLHNSNSIHGSTHNNSTHNSIHSKSPRVSPRNKRRETLSDHVKVNGLNMTTGAPPLVERVQYNNDNEETRIRKGTDLSSQNFDDMPPLVDDSILREHIEGSRSGKQWKILEDTPAGHAPEKLSIVPAVDETGMHKHRAYELVDEPLDEADDIVDEDEEGPCPILYQSESEDEQKVLDRPNALPDDLNDSQLFLSPTIREAISDRFNPAFQSNEMWRRRCIDSHDDLNLSADVSLVSDNTLTNHTYDLSLSECSSSPDRARTTATEKRAGGRIPERRGCSSAGHDEHNDEHDEIVEEEENFAFSGVHRDEGKAEDPREKMDQKKPVASSTSTRQNTNSNSTGRSSRIRNSSGRTSSKNAAGNRRTARNRIPDVVPAYTHHEMSPIGRSPVSSSFTSTPSTSFGSSGRRQAAAMQSLRKHSHRSKLPNKPLQLHVRRDHTFSDDDDTLGASTISTNFTTTQRTHGTVSTRSLFRSTEKVSNDCLRLPQRRRGDSDDEQEGYQEGNRNNVSNRPIASTTEVNANFDFLQSPHETEMTDGQTTVNERSFLRRPSGEGDEILFAVEELFDGDQRNEVGQRVDNARNALPAPNATQVVEGDTLDSCSDDSDGSSNHVMSDGHVSRQSPVRSPKSQKKHRLSLFQRMQSWKSKSRSGDDAAEHLIR